MQYAQSARSAGAPRRKKRVKSKPAERGSMDLIFLILVLTLLGIGLIMLFSASYAYAYYYDGNSFHYITRQLAFAVVGVVALLVVSQIDYHILRRFALLLLGGTLFLLVLVLFYHTQATAKRWIPIVGTFTFQPSELAKFTIVVVFAHLISLNYDRMSDPRYGLWPFLSIMGIIALLMVLQPHLSGTILILSIGVVMMFIGGTNLKWFALGGLFLVGAVVVIIFIPDAVPYAMSRLEHWINPASDPTGAGYQTLQSLYAIGSGGLLGVGIGNSRQKHLYLPEPQNDFVFSVIRHRDALPRPVWLDACGRIDNTGGCSDHSQYRGGQQHDPQHRNQSAIFLVRRNSALYASGADGGCPVSIQIQHS